MQNITDVNTFTSPVTVLSDGDPVVAAESIPTAQALANRTAYLNNNLLGLASIVTAAGTTTLTALSNIIQLFTGTAAQTVVLPDETTIPVGRVFEICNFGTGILTVHDSAAGTIHTLEPPPSGDSKRATNLVCVSTSAGAATGGWVVLSDRPGHTVGSSTNSDAVTGEVGEIISASANGTAYGASNTPQNFGSLALTAGVWRISANADYGFSGDGTQAYMCLSTTSASIGTAPLAIPDASGQCATQDVRSISNQHLGLTLAEYTVKLSGPITLFVVGSALFSTGGVQMTSYAQAERAR